MSRRRSSFPSLLRVIHSDTHSYQIKKVSKLKDDEGNHCNGMIDFDKNIIYINREAPLSEQWVSLWEELLHSFFESRGLKFSHERLKSLAEFLTAVCKENGFFPQSRK